MRTPLPLSPTQATDRAAYLHHEGFSWAAIAKVMAVYHGQWYSRSGWYRRCQRKGLL